MSEAVDEVDPVSVEEIILQSYLFAGFPRALNAMRMWRVVSERPAPDTDPVRAIDAANASRCLAELPASQVAVQRLALEH